LSECSLFSATPRGSPLLAQTVDLHDFMLHYALVLRIASHDGLPEILMLTFSGLLGYLGINSFGIAVGINMVTSNGWRPGIPPYLLVRHLLTQSTLAAAQIELERLPRSSSRCLTLADTQSAIQIEMTADALRTLSSPYLLHTNHYLHPDLVQADRSHVLLRRNSRQRLNLLAELAARQYPSDSHVVCASTADAAENAFSILAHHGEAASICCHGRSDHRAVQTIAAAVMFPAEGELYLRSGLPCRSATQVYRLRASHV